MLVSNTQYQLSTSDGRLEVLLLCKINRSGTTLIIKTTLMFVLLSFTLRRSLTCYC